MKYQVLFSLKNNEKYLQMLSAAVVIGTLRVKYCVPAGKESGLVKLKVYRYTIMLLCYFY